MKNIIERIAGGAKIARYIPKAVSTRLAAAALAALAAGGAWAATPTPVAEWSGDLADASVKNTKYTMSMDPGDSSVVSFDNGNAILTSSKSVSSKGVQIAWPDPATDDASFTSRKMSVILQYSSLSILNGNTSLLSALWGDTATEYMVRTSSNNGTAGIATAVKSGATSAGTQYGPSSNFRAPTQGKLLVCFSGDSSHLPGIDLYFSTYDSTTATYGDYQRVSYWSGQKVDNGTFYGLKIGGTIANTSKYYRPGMTVEAVQIYDTVVSASSTAISANTSWSSLVWDHDVFDVVPASLYTYIINVSESATLDLSNATIPTAEKVLINVAADKTLTLTGTPTSSGAPIEIAGSGKVVLSSDPGCNVVVASGATLDISASTVSSAITNNGTVNANGCAFTGAVSNSGTLNTSGTVSFSSSASNSSSGTFNVLSGTTTYNSSSEKAISGTLNVDAKATFVNDKGDSILWDGTVHVHIRGIVTMNAKWTIGANNYIHLYDGALVNGSAGNAFHFNSGEGKIIAETGSSTITAPFVKGNGTIAKSGSGTLRLENQRLPSIKGSEGTIEVVSTESHVDSKHSHTDSNIPFSGTVKFITSSSPSGQYHMLLWSNSATAGMFANRPALDVSGEVRLYDKIAEYPLNVRNLCGTGTIRMGGATSVSGYRYIDTSQTANTVFDGMFTTLDSTHAAYDSALTVRGAVDATETYSLTLTGANNTTGPLVIENNAKVVFASTGSWVGGTVTVKNGGVLESQNSESIADRLVVQEGATLKFANGVPLAAEAYDWNGVSSDEAVNIDLGDISPSTTPVTLIASDVTVAASKFKVTASQQGVTLSVENGALKATFANCWRNGSWSGTVSSGDNATLYISQNSTLTVSEALTLGTVTVVKEGEDDVTLTVSGAGALTTDGWTIPAGVTVVTADGMVIAGDVTGGGVINVPANTTLTMDGVTTSGDTLADRVKVTVSGTLKTKGTTTLSAANTSAAGSLIEVVNGVTTLSSSFRGLSGNITIQSDGELKFAASYNASGADQSWDYLGTSSSNTVKVYGTLNMPNCNLWLRANNTLELYQGAEVLGSGSFASYGSLIWAGNASLMAYGDAEINATITTLTDCSPVFNVAENKTLTISTAFIGQALEITENPTRISGGSITKAGAGTLKLSNIAMTKPIMAGTGDIGTVELTSTSGNKEHTATGATFNGILHLTNTSSNQHIFKTTAAAFADGVRPEWILDSSDTYFSSDYYPGKVFYVRNLSGSGTFKAQYRSGNLIYTINTMQERNTVFSGMFTSDGSRSSCLTVVGDGSGTVNSLTLQNASSSTNTLTVSDNAKVVFASNGSTSGKWANGRVVVNANGWLESSISDAVKNLTLASGSHLVFPTESTAWTGITNITSTGTIDCSIGNGNTPAVGAYLINWTGAGLASAPGGTYSMSGAAAATVALKADTTGLKVVSPAASLTKSTGVTSSYADTMSALGDFINSRTTDIGCYVTILDDSEPLDAASLRTYQLVYDSSSKTYRHAVARIGAQETGVFYSSLATALASAVGGETVTLMFNNTDASITIPANVTLEIPAAHSISGTIAGAGAVDAKADFAPTFGEWTGTFIMDWADTANAKNTKIAFDKYGISGSTVQLNQNYKGWLANTEGTGVASDIQPTVILNATLHVADGYSKNPNGADAWKDTTKFSKLKSTSNGQLSLEGTPGGSGYKYYFHIDTLESFEGSITINGNYCLKIGKYNFPDYASASSFVVGTKLVALTYTTGSTIYNSSLQDPATAGIDVAMLGSTIPGNKLVYDTDGFYPAAVTVLISETTNYYKTYAAAAAAAVAAEVRRMTGTDATVAGTLPSGWYPEGAQTGTYVLPVASAEVTIDDPYVYGSTMVVTRYYASLADAIAAVDSEGTVTLMDNTGEAISLGKSIALDGDSYTFSGTFTGSGTVILDGASLAGASSSTWPAGWIGTVWLKNNVSGTQIFPANYGNANSVLKFTGVTGWLANGTTIASAVELEDDGDTKALTLNYTSAPETTLTFKEFCGSGTFATTGTDGIWPKSTFKVLKWDDFDGALSIDRGRLEFGTDTISTDDWCYIYVSSGETVAVPAGKTWYARDGVRVNGTLNVDATATLTHLNGGTGKLSGTGRVVLGAVRSSALAFGTWTGTVVLPAISETEGGIHFDWYGKAGSTIEIDKGFSGWLNASSDDTRNVKANLLISNGCQFTIVGTNSGTTYGFAKISGNGNFHLRQTNQPNSFTIGMLDGYSGTIVNDDDNGGTPTTLTIQKVKLAAAPTPGDKLVGTTTPDALTVATTGEFGVYVGNTQQSVTLAKGSDGIYVALVSVTKGDNPTTYYATVSDAMTAAGSDAATITLLGNTDSNVSLAVGQSLVTDGFSVGTVSTGAEHCHVVDNAGVYTVALDQFAVTIPSVANTTVSVSYTSGSEALVATAAGDIMVDYGTDVTAAWTAVSGYRITSGASQTLNAVASAQTLASPAVEAMGATVSDVSVSYGADYASATVTATVSDTALDYYISWASGEPVKGSVSESQVTFDVSGINHTTEYQSAGYTITAKDGETDVQTTGGSGTSVAADTTSWFSQSSANSGAPVNGAWTTPVNLSTPTNVTDNTFTTTESTSSRVVLEFNVCFSSVSDADVDGDAQGALKLGEVNSVTTFMVLTNGNQWAAVSNVGLTPDPTATNKVVMTFDYANNTYSVSVDNYELTDGSGSSSFPLAASRTGVKDIDFAGTGTLVSMKGDQVEGYMVVDANGERYASIADAIAAYIADPTIAPLRLLHSGAAPDGWDIVTEGGIDILKKIAKGLFFMAY